MGIPEMIRRSVEVVVVLLLVRESIVQELKDSFKFELHQEQDSYILNMAWLEREIKTLFSKFALIPLYLSPLREALQGSCRHLLVTGGGCSASRWPTEDGLQSLALLLVGSVL